MTGRLRAGAVQNGFSSLGVPPQIQALAIGATGSCQSAGAFLLVPEISEEWARSPGREPCPIPAGIELHLAEQFLESKNAPPMDLSEL